MVRTTTKQPPASIAFGIDEAMRQFRTHLEAGLKSPETIASYLKAVELARDYMRGLGMADNVVAVRREHIEMFLADMAKRNSSATVVNRFKGLRAFFRWLADEGEVKQSPMLRIPWPKLVEKPPEACSPEEIKAMLATCDRTFRGRRDAALIGFMVDTGWRVAEVLRVTVAMVHEERLSVPAKGGKTVTARLTPTVMQMVNRYLRVRKSDRPELWISTWDRPMDRHAVWEMLERRSNLAGIKHVHPHGLRHSHAVWWLSQGGNVIDLKTNMGHSSVRITERYLRYMEQDRALEARKAHGPGNLLK